MNTRVKRILLGAVVLGLVVLGVLAAGRANAVSVGNGHGNVHASSRGTKVNPPVWHSATCNIITGSVTTPPSFTLPHDPSIKWWVDVDGMASIRGVAPGTYPLDPRREHTITVQAVLGTRNFTIPGPHDAVGTWVHYFPRTVCASINPPPTGTGTLHPPVAPFGH